LLGGARLQAAQGFENEVRTLGDREARGVENQVVVLRVRRGLLKMVLDEANPLAVGLVHMAGGGGPGEALGAPEHAGRAALPAPPAAGGAGSTRAARAAPPPGRRSRTGPAAPTSAAPAGVA